MLDFRSPQHLLLEVILVDDASTKENLGKKLGKDTILYFFCHFFCLFFLKGECIAQQNCMITTTKLNKSTHVGSSSVKVLNGD